MNELISFTCLQRTKLLQEQQCITKSIHNIVNQTNSDTFKVIPYGSSSHGLFIKDYSDFNFCIQYQDAALFHDDVVEYVANSLSSGHKYGKIKVLHPAHGSKHIECVHKPSDRIIHIVVNDLEKLASSRFIAAYTSIDYRLKIICCIVKYWAKQRKVALSSYCLVLMVIKFLQAQQILPELSVMIFDTETNTSIWSQHDRSINLQLYKDFAANNTQSYSTLLADLFYFYGHTFNYHKSVVCVQRRMSLTKSRMQLISDIKVVLPLHTALIYGYVRQYRLIPTDILQLLLLYYHQHCRHCFCVQDPFNAEINVAANVDQQSIKNIKYEFKRAYRILSESNNIYQTCKLKNI